MKEIVCDNWIGELCCKSFTPDHQFLLFALSFISDQKFWEFFLLGLMLNGSHFLIGYFPWLPPQDFTKNTFLLLPPDLLLVVGFYSYFSTSFYHFDD
jgi:hypothetical protein